MSIEFKAALFITIDRFFLKPMGKGYAAQLRTVQGTCSN